MGVYNPMAKMPRACGECEDRYKCKYTDMTIPRRSDDCPLVEVKAPHGRLIDADELEEDDNWSEWEDGFTSYSRLQISTQPTVIEAEVE